MLYNTVMPNRHENREKIVFSLYQHLLLHKDLNSCFDDNLDQEIDEFVVSMKEDLLKNKEDYVDEIGKYLVNWKFDRLNLVEQAILLETVSEISQGINDKAVVIDEAVIMAKEYCDEESYKFINGVLDQICSRFQ